MLKRILCLAIACIFLGLTTGLPVQAGVPTDKIKDTTDKILAIVADAGLKGPEKEEQRRGLIRSVLDERFDWEEMAHRSLGQHWAKMSADELKEFIGLYRKLLERSYLNKVESYSGEKVVYLGDKVDGAYSAVKVKILTTKDQKIDVEYRMKNKDQDWLVYDIFIQGVSLVNNYRAQFNSILTQSTYQQLIQRLRDKISEDQQT